MQGVATASNNIFSRHLDMKFDLSDNRYKTLENIGTGAYGVVCSAIHRKSADKVAIKKIPNAFQELTTAKRTHRELKILRHFNHENVIGIREILMPKELLTEFKDVYVVMDLMESDLHQIIHSTQPFSLEHIRYFLYQIVRGLKYIHSANVVHRDLKPSNLLVNENCELKIGDFGMARGMSTNKGSNKQLFMTSYVATRWYRAPELLFCNDVYSMAVDMWSVGCIFAEMIGRKQIFPGKNPINQLALIVETLGMPPDQMLKSSNSNSLYNWFHGNFHERKPIDFHVKYPGSNKKAIDLLSKMLVFNPEERISVEDVLKHPFLSKYHDPEDEPVCNPPFDFSFEQDDLNLEQIRQRVGKMILKYQKNVFHHKSYPQPSGSAAQVSKESITPATSKPTDTADCSHNGLPMADSMLKGNQGMAAIFKVPATPVSSTQQVDATSDVDNLKPADSDCAKTDGLLVKTEQDVTGITSDIDMKSACTLANNSITTSQNLLATGSLSPTLINIDAPSSNVDMRSAGSTAAAIVSSQCALTANKETPSSSLNVSSSVLTPAGDVVMNSAVGTPSTTSVIGPTSTLLAVTSTSQMSTLTTHLGEINIHLSKPVASADDVTMHSARSINKPFDDKTTVDVIKKDVDQGAKMPSEFQQDAIGGDAQGNKTISDDTKALIKAALLNSALKNKLRKDSTSGSINKGGGKMTVTAQSRQREREEKRRHKMKRSQERQKKLKSKCKTQEKKKDVMLTDEDKNLLERWSQMQSGVSKCPGQSSQSDQNTPLMQQIPSDGECARGRDHTDILIVTSEQSSNPGSSASTELQMFANSSVMQITSTHHAVGAAAKVSIAQTKMVAAASNRPMTQSTHRRIMPKEGASSTYHIASSGTSLPFTLMAQAAIGQSIVNPTSSQSNNVTAYAGAATLSGITLAPSINVAPQTQFVITQNSVPRVSSGTSNNPSNSIGSFQPIRSMPNGPAIAASATNFPNAEHSPISEQHSYRSRIYSDRETPSPPSVASPPTYEEAIQAKLKTHSRNNSDGLEEFDTSLDNISPFKPSPKAMSFSQHSDPLPDLASVTYQFSKSMVEDIYPPLLALTPKGDGAGYGLGLDLEDFLRQTIDLPTPINNQQTPDETHNRPLDSAPLSASLLSDWLEVRNLNVDDMHAVQQELGMTSPFNMADMSGLGNISPPTKS